MIVAAVVFFGAYTMVGTTLDPKYSVVRNISIEEKSRCQVMKSINKLDTQTIWHEMYEISIRTK